MISAMPPPPPPGAQMIYPQHAYPGQPGPAQSYPPHFQQQMPGPYAPFAMNRQSDHRMSGGSTKGRPKRTGVNSNTSSMGTTTSSSGHIASNSQQQQQQSQQQQSDLSHPPQSMSNRNENEAKLQKYNKDIEKHGSSDKMERHDRESEREHMSTNTER